MKKIILFLFFLISFSQSKLLVTKNGIMNENTKKILDTYINTVPMTYSFFIVKHGRYKGIYKEVHLASTHVQCYAPLFKTKNNFKIYNVYCFDREFYNERRNSKPIFYIYNLQGLDLKKFTFEGIDNYHSSYAKVKNNNLIFNNIKIWFPKEQRALDGNIVCSIPGNSFFDSNFDYLKCAINDLHKMIDDFKVNTISIYQYYDIELLNNTTKHIPLTPKTLTKYNNIAYYLQQAGANEEAIYLLEKIIKKFPNRIVAYINLGDAYRALGEKDKARKAYSTYIEQMCAKGLQKKIPKKVLKMVRNKR